MSAIPYEHLSPGARRYREFFGEPVPSYETPKARSGLEDYYASNGPASESNAASRLKAGSAAAIAAAWDQRGGPVAYALIPDSEVEPEVVKAAGTGYRFAHLHLGVTESPALRFFRKSRPGDGRAAVFHADTLGGVSHWLSHTIGVRAEPGETTSQQACEVAAHEVYHLAASKNRHDEQNAHAYGVWAAEALTTRGGIANNVHLWVGAGPPLNYTSLKEQAEAGDVLVARNGRRVRVYRNSAQVKAYGPLWAEFWRPCPVALEGWR